MNIPILTIRDAKEGQDWTFTVDFNIPNMLDGARTIFATALQMSENHILIDDGDETKSFPLAYFMVQDHRAVRNDYNFGNG